MKDVKAHHSDWLKKELIKYSIDKNITLDKLITLCTKLYEKSYSALDIIHLLEHRQFLENKIKEQKRYEMLLCFHKVRKEFRNEKLLMLFILNFIFLQADFSLENISFM